MSAQTAEISQEASVAQAIGVSLPGGGDDPRHSDDFVLVKREIDKLRDNDYGLIHKHCCVILGHQAKDLRVAAYLVTACTAREGMVGLLEAAQGYQQLLVAFWEVCHPRRESARLAALASLNSARFEALAREAGRKACAEQVAELRRIVDEINALLRNHLGDEAPQWRSLDGWLKVKPQAPRVVEAVAPAAPEAASPATQSGAAPGPNRQEWLISSERDAHTLTCALSTYYRAQGTWSQALAYTRALRWGGLSLPPAEQGLTRVPAPRGGAIAALEKQQQQSDPRALLELCESLFLEPGGQFWLDLQYLSWQAAKALGSEDLALFFVEQTRTLLRRLPSLVELSFDDGRPFADPATRAWLDGLSRESSPTEQKGCSNAGADDWDQELADCLRGARELAAHKKLGEALGLLDRLEADNQGRRLRLQSARAALCLHGGRADVALPLMDALEEQAESCRLVLWDQPLALEIWRLALDVLRDCARKAPAEEKSALDHRARQLRARICRTNPAAAVQWL